MTRTGTSRPPAGHHSRTPRRPLRGTIALLTIGFVAAMAAAVPALGATAPADPAAKAIAWLDTQRAPDGSYRGFSPVGGTADVAVAYAFAGRTPPPAAVAFLRGEGAARTSVAKYVNQGPGQAGKVALALVAAGSDPTTTPAGDLVAKVSAAAQGGRLASAGDFLGATAVLALQAARAPVQQTVLDTLAGHQRPDGGFSFTASTTADTNTTAVVLMALAKAGRSGSAQAARAIAYLHRQQTEGGGWAYDRFSKTPGANAVDASSTGLVLSALAGLGQAQAAWAKNGVTPRDALLKLQAPSGAFVAYGKPDVGATAQAVPGVVGRSLADAAPRPAAAAARGLSANPAKSEARGRSWALPAVLAAVVVALGLAMLALRRRRIA